MSQIGRFENNGRHPFYIVASLTARQSLTPRLRVEAKGLKVRMGYTFECQYAKPINTAWKGSLPQANAGDIFIAAPLV